MLDAFRQKLLDVLVLSCLLGFLLAGPVAAQSSVLGELFPPSIPRAIERGLGPEGDLEEELGNLRYESVSTLRQAKAIIQLLKALPLPDKSAQDNRPLASKTEDRTFDSAYSTSVKTLLANVQPYSPAYAHIKKHGLAEIVRIYDALLVEHKLVRPDRQDYFAHQSLLKWLELCAEYQSAEGTDRVIEAIKQNLAPASYSWHNILSNYNFEHPESKRLYEFLANHLPDGELGYSVLWAVNMRASAENTFDHIFDSDQGFELLKKWLKDPDTDQEFSIIESIPHLKQSRQSELYKIVDAHADNRVRLASASTKAHDDETLGIEQLVQLCLDPKVSVQAQNVLIELEKENQIPAAARRRPFAIEAAIYNQTISGDNAYQYDDYLSEEESRVTDIEVVEELKLPGTPGDEPIKGTVVRFNLVGSDPLSPSLPGVAILSADETTCYVNQFETFLSSEDLASVYFVSQHPSLTGSLDYVSAAQLAELRVQWTGADWTAEEGAMQCQFDEDADYPQELIVFTRAKMGDITGFMVLDGLRSQFYPANHFHPDTTMFDIRNLHCGRAARRLPVDLQRPEYQEKGTVIAPEKIVQQCEAWLAELQTGSVERRTQLLEYDSDLCEHLVEYVEAVVATQQLDHDDVLLRTVDQLFRAQEQLAKDDPTYEYDLSPLNSVIEEYARSPKLEPSVAEARFEAWAPHTTPFHAESLARLAMRAGKNDQAQELLERHLYRDKDVNSDVMFCLTELMASKGQIDQAAALHVYAYQRLIDRASKLDLEENDWLHEEAQEHLNKMREQVADKFDSALEQAGLNGDFDEVVKNYRKTRHKRR